MKKVIPFAVIGVLLIAAGVFLLSALRETPAAVPRETPELSTFLETVPSPTPEITTTEAETVPENTAETEEYISPVDFESLRSYNSDIYAWLCIPGTDISYPVVQSAEDDDYYLNHDWARQYSADGALFTESEYNNAEFSDPVTVVYGHNMKDGDMFGRLRSTYGEENALENYGEIIVYLPDREIHYNVFAALPYDDRHLLYNYDFTDDWVKNSFFYHILSLRTLEAKTDREFMVGGEGPYIILSTCTYSNGSRFLVMGQSK